MAYTKEIIFAILLCALKLELSENRLTTKLHSIKCEALDKQMLAFKICRMKALNRTSTEISVYVALYQRPVNNVTFGFTIHKNGFAHRPMLRTFVDGCAFLVNRRRNPMASMIYKLMAFEKYSNMNHSCPYDHDIIVDKYRLYEYSGTLPIPQGRYVLTTYWTTYNVERAVVTINFEYMDKYV